MFLMVVSLISYTGIGVTGNNRFIRRDVDHSVRDDDDDAPRLFILIIGYAFINFYFGDLI